MGDTIKQPSQDALLARSRALSRAIEEKKKRLTVSIRDKSAVTPKDAEKLEKIEKKIAELQGLESKIMKLEKGERSDEYENAFVAMEQKIKNMESALASKEQKLGRIDELLAKMAKLDQLDMLIRRVDQIEASGPVGSGGPTRAGGELKKEIEEVTKIILDDSSTDQQKAEANIRLEKLMEEYEKTPEFRAEQQKMKEEKMKKHEPLNKAALEKLKKVYTPHAIVNDPELFTKVGKYPELKLISLESPVIGRMHESDFRVFSLAGALTLEELRAIRANLPKFRPDQKVQMGFLETLDNKIEERSNKGETGAKPKKAAKKLNMKKPPAGGGGDTGGLFAELLRKRGALAAHGDDGSSEPAPPPAAPSRPAEPWTPPPTPSNCPPPPPMPMGDFGGGPPSGPKGSFPPPPPPPPSNASSNAPPAPPQPSSNWSATPSPSKPQPARGGSPTPTPAPATAPSTPTNPTAPKPLEGRGRSTVIKPPNPASSSTGSPRPPPSPTSSSSPAPSTASSAAPKPGARTKLKPPPEAPPKEQVDQLKVVKDSIQNLSSSLKSNPDPKAVALVTRTAVNNIKALADMGKTKYPAESAELEACTQTLVVVVKEILSTKCSTEKFESTVLTITTNAARTLGYTVVQI